MIGRNKKIPAKYVIRKKLKTYLRQSFILEPALRQVRSLYQNSPFLRSCASSFNFHYPLTSLRSSSSCLRLLPRLPPISLFPSNFPSIMYFRTQFLRKMSPIYLSFLLFIVHITFISSLTLRNTSSFLP